MPFRNGGLEPDDIARARRRRDRAGRVQRRADRDRAPLRHRRDQCDRASGGRDRVRRRLPARRRVAGRRRSRRRRRAGDLRPQVPAATPVAGLGYCYLSREIAGAVRADQRRLEGRARPVRELLRAGDGPVADGVAVRQLDQLARGDRQRGGALGLRRLRRRRRLRPEPRAGRRCCGQRWPRSAGRRSTSPRPTAAPSCRCRSATPTRRAPGGAETARRRVLGPRRQPAAGRSTSTTTRTTSTGSRARSASYRRARDPRRRRQPPHVARARQDGPLLRQAARRRRAGPGRAEVRRRISSARSRTRSARRRTVTCSAAGWSGRWRCCARPSSR